MQQRDNGRSAINRELRALNLQQIIDKTLNNSGQLTYRVQNIAAIRTAEWVLKCLLRDYVSIVMKDKRQENYLDPSQFQKITGKSNVQRKLYI